MQRESLLAKEAGTVNVIYKGQTQVAHMPI